MHTLLAIAARPHPSARHEHVHAHVHVPETHHNAAVSADRYMYTPTDLVTRPLEARPYERHHQVRMREWILDTERLSVFCTLRVVERACHALLNAMALSMNQQPRTALGLVWDRHRALDGFHGLPAPLKRRSREAGNWIYSKRNVRAILHGLQDS